MKIRKLKRPVDGTDEKFYPVTIPQAVIDPETNEKLPVTLGKKAEHGYTGEETVKTLKAVETEKASHGYDAEETPKTLKEVEGDLVQLAGELNQTDAKIKDIESILSTSNPSQSAQISVSGVSPLALPKNASNGGMSIKLEGLTEDVGGVITNFDPTGRVRSVGKNLLNPFDVIKNLNVNSVSGVYTNSSSSYSTMYIPVKSNTSYIFSRISNAVSSYASYYDRDKNYISRTSGTSGSTDKFVSTPANCAYINICWYGFANEQAMIADYITFYNQMQLEQNSVSSTYEPYRETSLYLTAPELRSNGTVKDEIRKGSNGYELVKRISDVDGTVLTTPVISPISYGGVLNSAENGTVYHEPVIADAGVYGTNMPILLTDYPIASIEEIIKHENGVDTYLNVATAVIAPDGLSFTHPDLGSGDLVLFTYRFDKETTDGNITATFYDSNVVKIDTVTGKAYKITDVVTNGVLTRTLTEV